MARTFFLKLLFVAVFFAAFASPFATDAAPSVTSFNVSPSSGSSGYPFSITWTMQDAGGSSLVVPCMEGIKAKNGSTGSDITCDSKTASTVAVSDGALIKLINITGFSKTVSIKLIPKDTSGNEVTSQTQIAYATVSADPQPVSFFKTSATTTKTGEQVNLSWDIPDGEGANISIECKSGVKATSPSYDGDVPCGKQIFSKPLGKSATLAINFKNSSVDAAPVAITLFPAISQTAYNGINTATLTINVGSDIAPDPVVNYFKTPSSSIIYSGESVQVLWETKNTKGVNFKVSCVEFITASSSLVANAVIKCGEYILATPYSPKGDATFSFQNQSNASRNVTITLFPAFLNKDEYDATRSQALTFEIRPPGVTAAAPPPSEVKTIMAPPTLPTTSGVGTPTPDASSQGVGATPKPALPPPISKPKTPPPPTPKATEGIAPQQTTVTTEPEEGSFKTLLIPPKIEDSAHSPEEKQKPQGFWGRFFRAIKIIWRELF